MMKWNFQSLKQVSPRLVVAGVLSFTLPASAATLTLTDWTTLPFPPNADHADTYDFPYYAFTLYGILPITQIEMAYDNNPFVSGAGIHEIKSAAFLFSSGDLASTTVLESTVDRFRALIIFKTSPDRRLTGLAAPSDAAFVAYHGPSFGSATTSALWTVTYSNGSTESFDNGIIPEPGPSLWIAVSATLALCTRRAKRPRASA
jgi:hypothetical protein